jgi:hypothetical protein
MKHLGLVLLLLLLPAHAALAAPTKAAPAKAAPSADDESVQAARDIAKAGTKLFSLKKYKDALDVFLKSHEVHPLPEVVWNIARCYEELGDVENAIVFFEESAATDEDPKNRAEARSRADKLKADSLGVLALETVPAEGVQVEIDGKPAGATPLAARPLRKGVHDVRLTHEGYAPLAKSVEIVPNMKNSFHFELEALKAVLALDAPATVESVEVRLDGLVHGVFTLPTTLELAPGTRRVTITGLAEYDDVDRSVTLAAGESAHVELQKRKTSPAAAAVLAPGAAAGIAGVTPGDKAAANGDAAGSGAGAAGGDEGGGDGAKDGSSEPEKPAKPPFQRDTWYLNLLAGYTWGGFKGSAGGVDVSKSFSSLFDGYDGNVPLALRLGLGATLTPKFLLGVDFDNFFETGSIEQDLSLFGGYGTASQDLTLWLANVNAMLTWFPLGDWVYAKFGGGFSYEKVKASYDDGTSSGSVTQSSKGFGLAMGGGVAVGFGGGFHLLFDLQYGKQWFSSDGLDSTWTFALCGGVGWY